MYRCDMLPNGYYRIVSRRSGLTGLYHSNGKRHAGDLRLTVKAALLLIDKAYEAWLDATEPCATAYGK